MKAERALRESERRNREFAADIAHELRTPLAILRTRLENLSESEQTRILIDHVDGMTQLISQLSAETDLENLSVGPEDVADLRTVCGKVVEYFAPLALKQDRMIEVTGSETAPMWVNGQEAPLEQALRNLVHNGIKFSDPDTTVTIDLGAGKSIGVISRGETIPVEQRASIFDRFSRSDRKEAGSGLGLAIVKRVVEAHGASIAVEEAPGGGIEFRIRFP